MSTARHPRVKVLLVLMMSVMMLSLSGSALSQSDPEYDQPTIPDSDLANLVTFRDVSNFSGLGVNLDHGYTNTDSFTPGVSWGDYDNDGWIDLFITANFNASDLSSFGQPHLMHNNQDGTFTDVTAAAGLSYSSQSLSGVWGDFDGDDDLDLYISEFGTGFASHDINLDPVYIDRILNGTEGEQWDVGRANKLYQNNGDGTFSDVTTAAGVGNDGHSTEAEWVDYDLDGDLDLYSLNWGIYLDNMNIAYSETNILYQNQGDGTFLDVTAAAELYGGYVEPGTPDAAPNTFIKSEVLRVDLASGGSSSAQAMHDSPYGTGMSWASLWFDYNNDMYMDIFIATDFGISPLYINDGDGTFTMFTVVAGLGLVGSGMGVDAGDYDNDGDLDLCQSNFGPEYIWTRNGVNEEGYTQVVNIDKVSNPEQTIASAGAVQVTWMCEWFDYDHDKDLDLFFSAGSLSAAIPKRENVMYLNVGDWSEGEGDLIDVLEQVGLYTDALEKTQGAAVGDYDNDGDLDLVLGNSNEPIRLYENLADEMVPDRHWIMIDLRSSGLNTRAIGAYVQVTDEQGDVQFNTHYACSGSFGCSDERMHFGLGDSNEVDIKIWWPSGEVSEYDNIAADRIITLHEPTGTGSYTGIFLIVGVSILLAYLLHRKGN